MHKHHLSLANNTQPLHRLLTGERTSQGSCLPPVPICLAGWKQTLGYARWTCCCWLRQCQRSRCSGCCPSTCCATMHLWQHARAWWQWWMSTYCRQWDWRTGCCSLGSECTDAQRTPCSGRRCTCPSTARQCLLAFAAMTTSKHADLVCRADRQAMVVVIAACQVVLAAIYAGKSYSSMDCLLCCCHVL